MIATNLVRHIGIFALAATACNAQREQTPAYATSAVHAATGVTRSASVGAPRTAVTVESNAAQPAAMSDSLRARFARAADSLQPTTRIPVEAPRRVYGLPGDDSLYITIVSAKPAAYELVIGTAEDCDGGNWCRVGTVTGRRLAAATPLPSGRPMKLPSGRMAVFEDATCGANCSDAVVTWDEGGVRYSVGKKAGTIERLRAMTESVIRLP